MSEWNKTYSQAPSNHEPAAMQQSQKTFGQIDAEQEADRLRAELARTKAKLAETLRDKRAVEDAAASAMSALRVQLANVTAERDATKEAMDAAMRVIAIYQGRAQ